MNPKRVYLVRGNHETSVINMVYGFAQECAARFGPEQGESIWKAVNQVFDMLPLAAVIEKRILCVHGGIGPSFTSIEQLFHLQKPIELEELRMKNEQQYWLVMHLLWADPADSDVVDDYEANPMRGDGIPKFPSVAVKKFCDDNNIDVIIRAHQPVMGGFELFAEGQLMTVFSATNYCGRENNYGGMLEVNTELQITAKVRIIHHLH
jgi:diadenosine tetraphosphatase ApaH/serine/threonine PP2A family protein phosphatase